MSLLGPNLEAFLAITTTGTVQAAAGKLGITQTGVTQRIRSLENQLDVTLFIRSRQGMRVTAEGEALLRYCQNVRDLEGETLAKMRGAGTRYKTRVNILGPTSLMRMRVIPRCVEVMKTFPELLVSFEISDSRSGSEALRRGEVQFAIIPHAQVANEMDSKRLKPEEYVLVGPRAWKNRPIKEIVSRERIIDFDETDNMTQSYLKKFKLLDVANTDRHFVNNNESLLEMFKNGIGYGVLTKEFANEYIKSGAIAILNNEAVLENHLALAWYPRTKPSAYFNAIVNAIARSC